MSEVKIEERVERGAQALDKCVPGWWAEGVLDLGKLRVNSGWDCVLGQLWGDFTCAPLDLRRDAVYLGFDRSPERWPEYEALTKAWLRLIERRRVEHKPDAQHLCRLVAHEALGAARDHDEEIAEARRDEAGRTRP